MIQNGSDKDAQTKAELKKINELLRDSSFAVKVSESAKNQDSNGRSDDTTSAEQTITKSFIKEKTAINLAGVYATVCGVNAISAQTGKKPVIILKEITGQRLDSGQVNLLNRFANATWKASQPFRDMSRITRDNFIVFAFLSEEEIKKDYDQVLAASTLLLTKIKSGEDSLKEYQWQQLAQLLHDTTFAHEAAAYIEAAYYEGQHQPVPPFISAQEETAVITKIKKDEDIASSLSPFYALACGVEYLSNIHNQLPSSIIQSIINNSLKEKDKELLQRFADATHKTARAFINLDDITRKDFVPYDVLPQENINKGWKQIQDAAVLLQSELK